MLRWASARWGGRAGGISGRTRAGRAGASAGSSWPRAGSQARAGSRRPPARSRRGTRPRCRSRVAGARRRPGRDRGEHRDAQRPADLVARRVEPGEHPGLVRLRAREHGDRDGDDRDAQPDAGDQQAGEQVGGVAAAGVGAGQEQRPARHHGHGAGQRAPDAGVADDVGAEVDADPHREGHRQEREPALERAGAEHALEVDRAQQEGAEHDGRDDQHQQRAAADAPVGEALDAQQRLRGAELERRERGEPGQGRGAEAERLRRQPSPRCRPARPRTRARRG